MIQMFFAVAKFTLDAVSSAALSARGVQLDDQGATRGSLVVARVLAAYLLGASAAAGGQAGVDPSFQADLRPDWRGYQVLVTAAHQSNGQLLVSYVNHFSLVPSNILARLHPDGSRDETFEVNIGPGEVKSIVLQPDARILIGGSFTEINGSPRAGLTRLLPTGEVDTTFNLGTGLIPAGHPQLVTQIALQEDGKFVIAGSFTQINGMPRKRVARLLPDGSVDPAFIAADVFNRFSPPNFNVLLIQPDGKILVAGDLTQREFAAREGVLRLNPDGSFDSTFDARVAPSGKIEALAFQEAKLLVGGVFTNVNGLAYSNLARVNLDGSTDLGFKPVPEITEPVHAIQALSTGRILIGSGKIYSPERPVLRLLPDGTFDETFNPITNGVTTLILSERDGMVVVGGIYWEGRNVLPGLAELILLKRIFIEPEQQVLIQLSPEDRTLTENQTKTFPVRRVGNLNQTVTVNLEVVGGSAVAGEDYLPFNGSLTFQPSEATKDLRITGLDDGVAELDETILIRLSSTDPNVLFDNPNPVTLVLHDNESTPIVDLAFAPVLEPRERLDSMAVAPDGKIYLRITRIPENPVFGRPWPARIVRVNPDGSVDPGFAPIFEAQPYGDGRIWVDNKGRLLAHGIFTFSDGSTQTGLTRITPQGQFDPSFFPRALINSTGGITFEADGQMLVRTDNCAAVIRLTEEGMVDASFRLRLSAGGCISQMGALADGKLLVSVVSRPDFSTRVIRLNQDGTLDATFNLPAFPELRGWAVDSSGNIIITGRFENQLGISSTILVRLKPDGSLDPTFHPSANLTPGPASLDRGLSAAVDSQGRILLHAQLAGWPFGDPIRLNPDGSFDPTFGPVMEQGDLRGMSPLPDSSVVLLGDFSSVNGNPVPGIARIYENNRIRVIEFREPVYTGNERDREARIAIRRLGNTDNPASVRLRTTNGSAEAGVDYLPQDLRVTFAPLEVVKTFHLPLVSDFAIEPVETVRLLLTEPELGVQIGRGQAEVRIEDFQGAGTVDSTFQTPVDFHSFSPQNLALMPDGHVLLAGFYLGSTSSLPPIVRLNADGSVDSTFHPADGGIFVLPLRDGSVVTEGKLGLHRLAADGSVLATEPLLAFNPRAPFSFLPEADLQSDDRIILAHPVPPTGPYVAMVDRYLPDLRKDPTFTSQNLGGGSLIFGMDVTRDDRILVAGNGRDPIPQGLIRLLPDGALDPTFRFSPDGNRAVMFFVRELADRKLIASGTFSITTSSQTFSNLVRLFPDGSLDPSFHPPSLGPVADLIEEASGKLIMAVGTTVVRLNSDGSIDPTFNADPKWSFGALKLLPNGQILGFRTEYWPSPGTAVRAPAAVRLNNDGRLIFGQPRLTSGGQFEIMSLVQPPAQYVLEFSQDLQNWSRIATNTATGNQLLWRAGLPPGGRGFFRAIRE